MAVADGIWFAGKTIMNFASYTLQEQVKSRGITDPGFPKFAKIFKKNESNREILGHGGCVPT